MDEKKKQEEQVNGLVTALGSFAEMSHIFFKSMIEAGATRMEATVATNAFVAAFWHEQMEDARKTNGGQNGEQG